MPISDDVCRRGAGSGRRGARVLLPLAFSIAACRGGSAEPTPGPPVPSVDTGPSAQPAAPEQPAPPEPGADAGSTEPFVPQLPTAGISRFADVAAGGSPSADIVALSVREMLQSYCGECHSDGANGDGFAGGLELASLIDSGLITPGSSASSPLLARILDGSMPAATPTQRQPPHPSVGELAVLADFIDQLSVGPDPLCEPLPTLGLDAMYAALLADVLGRPEADRPYLRYLGIADASNARQCGDALEQRRMALFKQINAVSTSAQLHLPVAIDEARLLFRIDIRDYGWQRPIDLGGDGSVDAADGWAALLPSAYPRAVALAGPEAEALTTETGTPVPFLTLSAFVRAVSSDDVYYALIGIGANLYDWWVELDLDLVEDLFNGALQRAAFSHAEARGDVIVTRAPLDELGERGYWLREVDDSSQSESIYDSPLDEYRGGWSQSLWELPNGLLAYAMNLGDGTPISQVPAGCVESCSRPEDRHPVACMACHANGLRPVEDQIREYVEEFRTSYDDETVANVQAVYPPAAQFREQMNRDDTRYRAALSQLGITPGAPDPVSRVYLEVDRPLDLERAAAELGLPATQLFERLDTLPPELAPLATPDGTIERGVFDAVFADVWCGLRTQNRPASCP